MSEKEQESCPSCKNGGPYACTCTFKSRQWNYAPDHEPDAQELVEAQAKIEAQARLIKNMEKTASYYRQKETEFQEAIKTLESEREANQILTNEVSELVETMKAIEGLALCDEPRDLPNILFKAQYALAKWGAK